MVRPGVEVAVIPALDIDHVASRELTLRELDEPVEQRRYDSLGVVSPEK